MDIEEIELKPIECPECGSDRTYWLEIITGVFKCEECNLVVDDDYYKQSPPSITIVENISEPK